MASGGIWEETLPGGSRKGHLGSHGELLGQWQLRNAEDIPVYPLVNSHSIANWKPRPIYR